MKGTILQSEDFKTNNWSGGTTTQLYIYPLDADYSQRDFVFRLSTASVNVEKSDFTSLPGVSRQLMVLEGETILIHENHHRKKLGKFDIDQFEGDWKTSSIGKCSDFNLMTKGKTGGILSAVTIEKDHFFEYQIDNKFNWFFIYAFTGKADIKLADESYLLSQGCLLVLNHPDCSNIQIEGMIKSELIFVKISIKD